MWLKKLQIAIIEKNTDALDILLDETPKLECTEDMEKGLYLLREANKLLHQLKDDTGIAMKQLKRNIDFLESTEAPKTSNLDIKS